MWELLTEKKNKIKCEKVIAAHCFRREADSRGFTSGVVESKKNFPISDTLHNSSAYPPQFLDTMGLTSAIS